jgi:anthranilate synthase/aminodeoxychorismate synthase-like glutamine amidotransferase
MIASMIADIKERSEHRMLVDLMRNDLSSICKVGTVNIAQFDVESYANVHHLVSHIKGELLDEKTSGDALDAIFPGGSITGCPRTMVCAAIDQIEHSNRSFWTGSVGWFDPHNDNCSWNILIRTLEAHKLGNRWEGTVGAGGGITILSDPDLEVAESIWKSQAIRKACGWLKTDFDLTNSGQLETTTLDIENSFHFSKCGSVSMIDDLELDSKQIKSNVMIIDNLDSFTLNIAHVIAGLGHDVCVINGRDIKSEDYTKSNFLVDYFREHAPSHIVLGPGPGKPQDSKLTMKVAQLAIDGLLDVPLLGVCLGHQAIGIVDGYQLIKDPNGAIHGTPVTCQSDGSGLFASTNKSSQFVRYNSLIVIGEGQNKLIPNVFDENGSIMGLRHKTKPIHGVQFHPESIGSVNGIEIIMAFLVLQSDA